ncbi:MAG: outer membrane protein assembly factor BamA [Lentimicrobiaceae bacterium]|jgi:outer membrane protein insertion porin family|nr:outer membrane protein assembly factor BamA [Lentimicrobiaceae bacterium]MDG1902293.1 POTRA domain-containing protein [Bacteroidales bacterium]MDG2081273.1 POTRA domain-containing protein [Bacteroidales bacterium]|tara:strand:- start:7600 stop:10248 length:2649 start_codon:yes stop_codon:yes gene_type:complete
MISDVGNKILKLTFILSFLLSVFLSEAQISIGNDLSRINYEAPTDYIIGDIEVEGVEYLDENVIIMLSNLEVGEKIKVPGDAITGAIRRLWDQGLFDNISIVASDIKANKIFLKIILHERPRLSKFSFNGIRKTEADDIREKINLSRGDVVTDHLLIRTKNIIEDFYADKGFLNSEITITEKTDKRDINFIDLTIDIKKNKKVKIKEINIYGVTELSADAIKSSMRETKARGTFTPLKDLGPFVIDVATDVITLKFKELGNEFVSYFKQHFKVNLFKGSKYIKSNYKEDLNNIIAKYNKKGYRDAQIVKDSVYIIDNENIGIDIYIDEGSKYYFRNITWVGNKVYNSLFLSSVLGILPGDVYNLELLETNLNYNPSGFDVSSLYMNNGYLFFNATPVETYVGNDSIDLEIRIFEGKQARIRNVSVKGNTKTNDHVVIRELRTRPGQLFSREDVIRTTRELANLRYFDPESITPNINPDPANGTVDIEYEVEETSADQIELSGGWGYGRIIGTLGLSFNNFSVKNIFKGDAWRPIPSGDGQKLSLRFQTYGKDYLSWSVSFTEPWLGGKKPNALTISYYHSIFSNGLPTYDTLRSSFVIDGITIGIGKRLTWPDDFFTLYQGVNLQLYKLDNYATIFYIGDGNGTYNNFNYEIILGRNSIDQPIYPRRGSDISLGLELTPPYSLFSPNKDYSQIGDNEKYKWIEYHKWKFKAYWYFELMEKLVLATKFRFGYLGYYNSDLGVTPFERFYLGGDGLSGANNFDGREIISMRGYTNESITPYYYQNKNIGGTVFTRYTLELRYPLSLNPSSTIYALTFVEAGNSWLGSQGFDPFDMKRSAGFGVRVFLPMFGMLGLDWAYGFDPIYGIPSANGSHFHFSLNQSLD